MKFATRVKMTATLLIALSFCACAKPLATAKVTGKIDFVSRDYAATANDIYYALKWALVEYGYPVANENLADGVFTTAWLPVRSDSHYIRLFNRNDYGVTNSYYQLELQVVPQGGRTLVRIGSRAKSLVINMKSSGFEERKILDSIGNRLRKEEPEITNLGVNE